METGQKEKTGPVKASSRREFDRDAARRAASAEVERARRAESSVLEFHEASEKIEGAQSVIEENSRVRLEAIKVMRECGYSVARIAELTGLSSSRIQKLLSH